MENIEEKRMVLMANERCSQLNRVRKEKVLKHRWNHLSQPDKEDVLNKMVDYQGERVSLREVVNEKIASEIFNPEVLSYLMTEEKIHVGDGIRLFSQGYNEDYYIERSFVREIVDDGIFDEENGDYYLFVTGFPKEKLGQLIEEHVVQIIEKEDDDLLEGKNIIMPVGDKIARNVFERISQKDPTASFHWLHFLRNAFYWRMSKGSIEIMEKYRIKEEVDENKLIETTNENMDRIVLISGDSGSGKSTILSELLRKMKGSNVWVGRVNFSDYADSKENPRSLANVKEGGEAKDIIDYLFRILNVQNPLEQTLLKDLMNRDCKVKLFVDGFDELSLFYKAKALTFLRTLKNYTHIQMWITTRDHERMDLETELEEFSHGMKPFSTQDQVCFFSKYWKFSLRSHCSKVSVCRSKESVEKIREKTEAILVELKHSMGLLEDSTIIEDFTAVHEENSKEVTFTNFEFLTQNIQKLDFFAYARVFLGRAFISMSDEEKRFTALPLNLSVLAGLSYHENLKMRTFSDLYHLYSDFVLMKIEIYMKEKLRYTEETHEMIEWNKTIKNRILKFHRKISMSAMQPERYPIKPIKESHACKYINVGLLTNVEGHLQFVHRGLAEYFFGEFVLKIISQDKLEKGLLEEILLQPGYESVRNFIDSKFQSNNISFGEKFIKGFVVIDMFSRFFKHATVYDIKNCWNIWKGVIQAIEQHSTKDSMNDFISKLVEASEQMNGGVLMEFFKLLDSTLSDEIFSHFLNSIEFMRMFIFPLISRESAEYLRGVLATIKRLLCYEACRESQNHSMITSRRLNAIEVDGVFENIREPYGVEQGKRLLEVGDEDGWDVFNYACWNEDDNAFPLLISFFRVIVGDDVLSEYITKRDHRRRTTLHWYAKWLGFSHIRLFMNGIRDLLEKSSFGHLVMEVDEEGRNFLHYLALSNKGDEMKQTLSYLSECISSFTMKYILLQRDAYLDSVLHSAAGNGDIVAFEETLKAVRSCMSEEEFKKFVISGDIRGNTIFHNRALYGQPLCDLRILENYIGGGQLRELIREKSDYGRTCLHVLLRYIQGNMSQNVLVDDLRFLSEMLGRDYLEEFLSGTDKVGDTFLHCASENEDIIDHSGILRELKRILAESSFQKLLNMRNDAGEKVLPIVEDSVIKLKKVEME